jgi:hypothetical protein
MKFLFLLILLIGHESLAQTSYVAPTRILARKGYQLGFSLDVFNSTKRVDDKGDQVDYASGESFSRRQGEINGYYGLTENLQIGAGVRVRQNVSSYFSSFENKIKDETSTGVESTVFQFLYAFKPVNSLRFSLEGSFRMRPYSNEESNGTSDSTLILGDSGNEYSGGVGVTYTSRSKNFLTARVGYRDPGKDISDEIYWQAEGAMVWNYVALIAGVDGMTSLSNDPFNEESLTLPVERPVYNRGSTLLYHGINRELISPYVGINLALGSKWRLELKGSQVISGVSTDLGTSYGVSLVRRVEEQKVAKIDRAFKEYDFEASVTKVSPKKTYVVIDKGLSDDVRKGLKIDFFEFDYVGGNILLASGIVTETKSDTAIVKITTLYNRKRELKEGVIARGSLK